jgi:dTDP-4-dehydrorhamnose reductase
MNSPAKRSLIIGTSGQLATELHRQAGALQVQPAQKVDVADEHAIRALLDEVRPALVINASAYTAVDRAEQERERAFAVNASGPRYLARWCAANGAALIHISTDYVFNGAKASAYVEDDAVGPLNVYGESKLAGEIAIREELTQHLILRTSWVFSAHGQNFVKTMRRLAAERDELRVIADQHGRPTSAADLAGAVWRIASERLLGDAPIAWGTYHLANADPTTWHGFAEAIVELEAGHTSRRPVVQAIPATAYPTPAKRPANSVLDTGRFEAAFGFGLRSFRLALRDVMDELQRH